MQAQPRLLMRLRQHVLTAFCVLTIVRATVAGDVAKIADIPADAPTELKRLIEQTFSSDANERMVAAKAIGEMHERAAVAVPFLFRLVNELETNDVGDENTYVDAVFVAIGEPAVDGCIDEAKNNSHFAHWEAMRYLTKFESPRALDALLDLLNSPNAAVRQKVVLNLEKITDSRATLPLLRFLDSDDTLTRRAAAACFASLRDPRALGPLLRALPIQTGFFMVSEYEMSRRCAVVRALGFQRDTRANRALRELLRDPKEDQYVRGAAAKSLGQISSRQIVEPLLEVIQDGTAPTAVRQGAVAGIGAYRPSLTIAEGGDMESVRDDVRLLIILGNLVSNEDESRNLRTSAACAMGEFGNPRAVKVLTKVANSRDDQAIRFWAAVSVVKLTKGSVEAGIVSAIRNYRTTDFEGSGDDLREQRVSLKRIAERGVAGRELGVPVVAALVIVLVGLAVGWRVLARSLNSVKAASLEPAARA